MVIMVSCLIKLRFIVLFNKLIDHISVHIAVSSCFYVVT